MPVYEFGPFRLNVEQRFLQRNGEPLAIESKPLEILALLIKNNGCLVTKDRLMQKIWPNTIVEDSNLTVCISKIRKLLGDHPRRHKYIATLPRRGYRFVGSVRELEEDPDVQSLAVLPFDNSNRSAEIEYLT